MKAANKKYKAGVIGCGRIASLFAKDKKRSHVITHAQAYAAHPRLELIAAADVSGPALKKFGRQWNVTSLYADYQDMLKDENLDIVSICAPQELHFKMCQDAILAGVGAIFCEKPVVTSLSDADKLNNLVKRHGVAFAVNHSRRWDPFEQRIQKYIAKGSLGKLQSIDAYYSGGIANTGTHLIDLIRMLTSLEVESVRTLAGSISGASDPALDVQLTMTGGSRVYLHALAAPRLALFEIDIYGDKGRLRVANNGFDAQLWRMGPHPRIGKQRSFIEKAHSFGLGNQDKFKNALNDILKSLEQGGATTSSIDDGIAALEVIIAARESAKQSGRIMKLPLQNRRLTLS